MEKIYSRKRIKLPKLKKNEFLFNKNVSQKDFNNKKIMIFKIIIIIFISVNLFIFSLKQLEPIINSECRGIAKSIAIKVTNEQTSNVMANYKYDDLCIIEKDSNGNIKLIKSNVILVNEIISKICLKVQEEVNTKRGK